MATLPTVTLTVDHFHELVREAYKQGYLNARADADGTDEWQDGEEDFDDWLADAMAETAIGDIPIQQEEG